jgi:curli biogenesis system outer membrane secretion channel CsgG
MKKITIAVIVTYTVFALLAACTSVGRGKFSLQDAIEQSAKEIAGELPPNSSVAIVAFESANDNLSEYIMEELNAELLKNKVRVVDRQNLQHIQKELDFHMSGYVSDESAMSIGKFLGATVVITGELIDVGDAYRYRVSVINVEEARRGTLIRHDVRNDKAMRRLVTTLGNQR